MSDIHTERVRDIWSKANSINTVIHSVNSCVYLNEINTDYIWQKWILGPFLGQFCARSLCTYKTVQESQFFNFTPADLFHWAVISVVTSLESLVWSWDQVTDGSCSPHESPHTSLPSPKTPLGVNVFRTLTCVSYQVCKVPGITDIMLCHHPIYRILYQRCATKRFCCLFSATITPTITPRPVFFCRSSWLTPTHLVIFVCTTHSLFQDKLL